MWDKKKIYNNRYIKNMEIYRKIIIITWNKIGKKLQFFKYGL